MASTKLAGAVIMAVCLGAAGGDLITAGVAVLFCSNSGVGTSSTASGEAAELVDSDTSSSSDQSSSLESSWSKDANSDRGDCLSSLDFQKKDCVL